MKRLTNIKAAAVNNNNGLTLLELMIASLLLSFTMIGISSIDLASRRLFETTSQRAILSAQTSGLMMRMSQEIYQAVGDRNDPGIIINPNPGNTIIFRIEDPNNPGSYIWIQYSGSVATKLSRCEKATSGGICLAGAETLSTDIAAIVFRHSVSTLITGATQFNIDIDITTRPNPTAAASPIMNPEFRLLTSLSPPGHSW